ncbi:hypothetical protein Taro_035925 [Colocasia esculenta]|uniref:Uncharacterized protein n=1 Tax=Colocasia esculenta TaxID=4460 RepID=A0A843WBW4_COLES|nr:hypothetical protein [Colocasia esculenta]
MAQELQQQLRDVGSKLENPPASKDALIKLLKQAANCLSELEQSPLPSMLESMQPCLNAIAKPELLKHQDKDVRVLVAMCICEITRITAPEAPYSDDILRDVPMAARKLAMNIVERCALKLEPYVKQFLVSSMSGDNSSLDTSIDYHEVIYDLYRCAPHMLYGVIPYITGELLTDELDVRLKAVKLLGDLFSLPGHSISEYFQPLFSEFLKRLTDRVVEVRVLVIEHVKNCLISNPSRPEASEIVSALCDRLLDYDEHVRKQVVAAIYDVACHELSSIPSQTARLVAERVRDKSLSVKKYTVERLAEVYNLYCLKSSNGSFNAEEFEWIPGKILRCLYDKDFR